MTSNFTASELRELADRLETRSFDYQPNPFCLHCAAALREYAQLIDTVLDGVDVVTDDLVPLPPADYDKDYDRHYLRRRVDARAALAASVSSASEESGNG